MANKPMYLCSDCPTIGMCVRKWECLGSKYYNEGVMSVIDLHIKKAESHNLNKLYHVISDDGENYFTMANSFAEAEQNFMEWQDDPEADGPQAIMEAGWLLPIKVKKEKKAS